MKGKSIIHPGVHIRGDMKNVRIGRYCSIGENTIIRPPSYQTSIVESNTAGGGGDHGDGVIQFLPSLIGNHTRIGRDCVIESASIGACVYIASNVVISKRVLIKDCCYIEEGTMIPPDTVIPPFSRVAGCPAKTLHMSDPVLEIPESVAITFVQECINDFACFVEQLEADEEKDKNQ
jgi:dynactin-5